MNKTTLIIILMLQILSYNIVGQPYDYDDSKYLLKKLFYTNSSGEEGVTTFIFDKNNMLYKAIWELTDSSRSSVNLYTLNGGNISLVNRKFSDGLTSKKQYEYSDKGKVIAEYFTRSDSVEGMAKYQYDENNRLVRLICERQNGWFTGEIRYTYNNEGKREKANIFRDNAEIGIITYTFSPEGNLLKEEWDFNGQWKQVFTYRYILKDCNPWINSNPLLSIPCEYQLTGENYDYSNQSGSPSYFKYDSGRLVEKTFKRSDGLETITGYEYDDNRRLVRSFRQYSDSKTAEFTYHYNTRDQIIEKIFNRSDGLTGKESFTYDIHGNLRFARYDNMDSWLTGNLVFILDRYDRLKGGIFTSDEGYDATLEFTYGENDMVRKIHWVFSFGGTQTYTFEYRTKINE